MTIKHLFTSLLVITAAHTASASVLPVDFVSGSDEKPLNGFVYSTTLGSSTNLLGGNAAQTLTSSTPAVFEGGADGFASFSTTLYDDFKVDDLGLVYQARVTITNLSSSHNLKPPAGDLSFGVSGLFLVDPTLTITGVVLVNNPSNKVERVFEKMSFSYQHSTGTLTFANAEDFVLKPNVSVTFDVAFLTGDAPPPAAVPEPSTYAAIFGSVALGFAAYRRRAAKIGKIAKIANA